MIARLDRRQRTTSSATGLSAWRYAIRAACCDSDGDGVPPPTCTWTRSRSSRSVKPAARTPGSLRSSSSRSSRFLVSDTSLHLAPGRLGLVEPAVGEGHELGGRLGLGRALRDAVGERGTRALADLGRADALEQGRDVVGVGARQDERELVAADAGRVVTEAQDPAEPLAERLERRVALLVALGVVDLP